MVNGRIFFFWKILYVQLLVNINLAKCQPIIGVEGCHLKRNQKESQLLIKIGIEGNNTLYHVAFTLVEGEINDTWSWFLTIVDEDI